MAGEQRGDESQVGCQASDWISHESWQLFEYQLMTLALEAGWLAAVDAPPASLGDRS